jgi:hypothetical protein
MLVAFKLWDNQMTEYDGSTSWELKPRVGLGEILFAMSQDAVAGINGYGRVAVSRKQEPIPNDNAAAFLQSLGLGDDLISEALKTQEDFARLDVVTESRDVGLVLEYDRSGLIEILANKRARQLQFAGKQIFAERPIDIVRHLAEVLEENPIILANEVVFLDHLLFLYEFVVEPRSGEPGGYTEGNAVERTILWRSKQREHGVDLSAYKPMVL